MSNRISAIVPTIGRVTSLTALLESLAVQTRRPDEIIVADGSDGPAIRELAAAPHWQTLGLTIRYVQVTPPNAVRQRKAAIAEAQGSLLLLLDDDVVLEPRCVDALLNCLRERNAVGVTADFSNQQWPRPTMLWRWYLRWCHDLREADVQGRVVGPLLRFGYFVTPNVPAPMEWLGSGNSLIVREAYIRAGGFSDFFLHRSTLNEDVDLGVKLARQGLVLLCPVARMAHMHAPGGRASARVLAEDDLYNRHAVLRRTIGRSRFRAVMLVIVFLAVETVSDLAALLRWRSTAFVERAIGRAFALMRIAAGTAGTRAS